MNEDKIKALEFAIEWLKMNDNYSGICDSLNFTRQSLNLPEMFREPSTFGIRLPRKQYHSKCSTALIFCYPTTKRGKQQRIRVLQQAIKKLQS